MRIKGLGLLIFVSALTILVTSCQKEINDDLRGSGGSGGGTGATSIIGDYDFIGLSASTSAAVTVSDPTAGTIKTVTVSSYKTKNNSGTVKITSSQMIMNGVGYDIDTTMNSKLYIDNVLTSDTDVPFVVNYPATSSTSTYVKNSSDSITITGQLGVPTTSGTPSGPTGAKFSFSGDTLVFYIKNEFTQVISQMGTTGNLNGSINGVMKLKKK